MLIIWKCLGWVNLPNRTNLAIFKNVYLLLETKKT